MSDLIDTLRVIARAGAGQRQVTLDHYTEMLNLARIDAANAASQYRQATGQSFPHPSCKEESAWPQEWDGDYKDPENAL